MTDLERLEKVLTDFKVTFTVGYWYGDIDCKPSGQWLRIGEWGFDTTVNFDLDGNFIG